MKLYSFKMWDNGIVVRCFIPCKNTSGSIGLFDVVEQKFYTTSTGSFTAGTDISTSLESGEKVPARITDA